jgi:hypothetical protein
VQRFSGFRREGGRADRLDTCLAHWSPLRRTFSFELGLEGFFESSIPSHSEIFGETRRSLYFSPAEGSIRVAISATISGLLVLAQASTLGKLGPNKVPFKSNQVTPNFTGMKVNSQGDFEIDRAGHLI